MKLIVGLGNPGKQYEKTRHNFGFAVLDVLAEKFKVNFAASSYQGDVATATHADHKKVFLLKPQTFMNLSGQSVAPLASFYKIPPADVLVIYDDLDLPLGRVRFAEKGSAGGHNGIKSIMQCLGGEDFMRLKLGIGRPVHAGQSAADYVLQKFSKEEAVKMQHVLALAVEATCFLLDADFKRAMNKYNGTVV